MLDVSVRFAQPPDAIALAQMREALWPESSIQEHAGEVAEILSGNPRSTLPWVVIIAEALDHTLVGFIEVGLRSHADGCDTLHPVGYIEGWYVAEKYRNRGIGRKLVVSAEEWARAQGCVEMASDTWIDNRGSQRAHEALGYEVVDRCVNYRKAL